MGINQWVKEYYEFYHHKNGFTSKFKDDKARYLKAKRSIDVEFLTVKYFEILFGKVKLTTKQEEWQDIDFYWNDYKFSVKADWKAVETRNFPIEIEGWIKYSQADYFIFSMIKGFQKNGIGIVYDFTPFIISKTRVLELLPELKTTFITKQTRELNKRHRFRNYRKPHKIALLPVSHTVPLISFEF